MELEGEEGFQHLEEYSDSTTERGKQLRQCLRIRPLRRNAHGLDADNGGFCFLQNFDHSCPLTFLPF